jgi:DNA mismatch repair protein MutL
VRRVFGAELADALVPVAARDGTLELSGWLAPPRFARGDTSRQMWFLNGRPLRDKLLVRCLKQAFRGSIPDGRQPVAFLCLSMDPAAVDVNVHPTKSEVRFREERRVFGFLAARLREAALATDMATPGERLIQSAARRASSVEQTWPRLPDPGPLVHQAGAGAERALRVFELPRSPGDERVHDAPASAPASTSHAAPAAPSGWDARDAFDGPFLQVARTYVLRALPDGFEIVDQHALHERVSYEALLRQVREGRIEVQRFLVPALVELARAEVELLEEHLEALGAAGVELAVFGPTTLAVHGLPVLLERADPADLVRDVIGLLQSEKSLPRTEELLEHVLHSRACRSSIMAGDELSHDDMRALLLRAAELGTAQTCPHGRPTRVRFTLADLEKAFHRR